MTGNKELAPMIMEADYIGVPLISHRQAEWRPREADGVGRPESQKADGEDSGPSVKC